MGMIFTTPWERDHAGVILAGQAYQAAHDGALPQTPVWRMLEARYELAPARFAHWHPNVARMLSGRYQHAMVVPHHWTGCMRGPTREALTTEPPKPPSAVAGVPEPSSLVMCIALGLVVAWLLARRGVA